MDVYPPIFAKYTLKKPLAGETFSLLEIGNRRGETMRAYLEIFSFGDLYGLDLGIEEYESHQTQKLDDQFTHAHMFVGDQTDVFLLDRIGKEAISRNGGFDVINDDGGHHMKPYHIIRIR